MMKINIPGLHNSDENHWQTYFEKIKPTEFVRIQQKNWDEPDCKTWIETIEQELSMYNYADLVLIGHSIGCMAIIKWYERYKHKVKGALFVAPSDAERKNYPPYITGFTPIPIAKLPFPSIVVGSTNDHVTDITRTKEFADKWGSKLIILQDAGHIEPKSGYGNWSFGFELIKELESKNFGNF